MKMCKKIEDFYEKNFLIIDFIFSIGIIFFILFISKFKIYDYINFKNFDNINLSIIVFFGTMMGFLITLIAIIHTFRINLISDAIERLKNTSIFPKIYSVYLNTILIVGILVFLGFLVLFTNFSTNHQLLFHKTIFILELILISTFIFRIYRCIWILKKLINLSDIKK